jgi:4a-hydroxytetrahydrobiopterin dehydratase
MIMNEDWNIENHELVRTFVFSGFEEAMAFMQACSERITVLNHHPAWKNIYNKVEVRLCTHDAGNTITQKDRELAAIMDEIYNRKSKRNG